MPAPGVCMNIVNERHRKDGRGGPTNPDRFCNQDYKKLKEYCLIRRFNFTDDKFPPDSRSIGQGIPDLEVSQVKWLRPRDIVSNPVFVVDGVSRFDFGQGKLGNCWFLAALGALTFQTKILEQVVPLEQTFEEDYCGLFHFRFWRFGRWIDVVIDDKLPTINGQLIFVQSKDPRELWPALMEKAYAKVCGSYLDIHGGTTAEALVDFTGGVHINVKLSDPPADLWELMCRAGRAKTLMGCETPPGKTPEVESLPNGLVLRHAYSVTGVKQIFVGQVTSKGESVKLVRLWNPWGQEEWNGNWSDKSHLWRTVSPQDKELCLSIHEDGEFWMPFEDFCKFCSSLEICSTCPEFLDEGSSCHWQTSYYEGRWVAGTTAGGCINNLESFWTNPQYRVQIDEMADKCSKSQGESNMLVSLMQKPDKRNRRLVQNLHIGFSIYEITGENKAHRGKFPAQFFRTNRRAAHSKGYVNAREVMDLLTLKPGEYLIVPSTFSPNETASFILTIVSKSETHVHENSAIYPQGPTETNEVKPESDGADEEKKITLFRQFSDKYEEVDAEKLQLILNDRILKGDLKSGGFSIDACRCMVALMDTSVTGKLNGEEFVRLWKMLEKFKDVFYQYDVYQTGSLPVKDLRNAVAAAGRWISDDMLNLIALRYGGSTGHITMESFISLILRFDCMAQSFKELSQGLVITLREPEWMHILMYT